MDNADRRYITAGNIWVHEGDCVRDAELYYGLGSRLDVGIYRELYGLHPADVKKISKFAIS
jgi:hypothetical protein